MALPRLGALFGGVAVVLAARPAGAQLDINPPLPNVLLLVDTSGSMEYTTGGSLVSKCEPDGGGSERTRWHSLVEVLTGTVKKRGCYKMARDSSAFKKEFSLGGLDPYDTNYYLPYHRLVSDKCVAGPGKSPLLVYDWPLGAIKYHEVDDDDGCSFQQSADGLLDSFRDRVRFGLMTFDNKTHPGTGVSGATADYANGMAGLWSYYLNWTSGGTPAQGNPPSCELQNYEVGARNPAAPPWEGRMIGHGPSDATSAELAVINDHVQEALLAVRPYGATPIAGMMADAYTFIHEDKWKDPITNKAFAPAGDVYFTGGCRKGFIILLSDGEPNLDLRPHCEKTGTPNGKCPYKQPWVIAKDLAAPANPKLAVKTYTVGFGLSSGTDFDCTKLKMPDDYNTGGKCVGATGSLAACCTLSRIAYEGGTEKAYFADDAATLKSALSNVLNSITQDNTSRTMPVFASGAGGNGNKNSKAEAVSYQFQASFRPAGGLWAGAIERQRWICKNNNGVLKPELQPIDQSKGDDFVYNVHNGETAIPRVFWTVIAEGGVGGGADDNGVDGCKTGCEGKKGGCENSCQGKCKGDSACESPCKAACQADEATCKASCEGKGKGKVKGLTAAELQESTIRPLLATADNDGLGLLSGKVEGEQMNLGDTDIAKVVENKPGAMDVDASLAVCKDFQAGKGKGKGGSGGCAYGIMNWALGGSNGGSLPTRKDKEIGAIYHSTPNVVTPPTAGIRDSSYAAFAESKRTRPLVLFAATTDGQAHAFKVASNDTKDTLLVDKGTQNNELWSFLPPAVLPSLKGMYPETQQNLLDGAVIVRDVVFERDVTKAAAVAGDWKTVLVACGGLGGDFCYALDVTDPLKPAFLWQIGTSTTTLSALMGKQTPRPAITTLAVKETGKPLKEVAVAILAGGPDVKAKLATNCTRKSTNFTHIKSMKPRTSVPCYLATSARSLTIVRLKDGKILMSFRGEAADGPAELLAANVKTGLLDSPMSGDPIPYPSEIGQLSDRVYVGDADGTLWRFDLSKPTPNDWTAQIAFDAYWSEAPQDGQLVATPPIVSVDGTGNTVVLFSTGDQDAFTTEKKGMTNFVYSFLDKPKLSGSVRFEVTPNWGIKFLDGKRVTGPMSLFDRVLYFSTFTPEPPTSSCTDGFASLWGVDYFESDTQKDGMKYPTKRLKLTEASKPIDEHKLDKGTVVFGASISQTPVCFEEGTVLDPVLGAQKIVGSVSSPSYKLVFNTGSVGTKAAGSKTAVASLDLVAPAAQARIDSWAAVLE